MKFEDTAGKKFEGTEAGAQKDVWDLPKEFDPFDELSDLPKAIDSDIIDADSNDSEVESKKQGGSYKELKETSDGQTQEVHHMPADSASNLDRNDGPAIIMDKADHRETASCGNSREAKKYREKQRELIEQGKFDEAVQMDIDDIQEKFGDKYDEAIKQLKEYTEKLKEEGKIQ